jgi:hypothetical protein
MSPLGHSRLAIRRLKRASVVREDEVSCLLVARDRFHFANRNFPTREALTSVRSAKMLMFQSRS